MSRRFPYVSDSHIDPYRPHPDDRQGGGGVHTVQKHERQNRALARTTLTARERLIQELQKEFVDLLACVASQLIDDVIQSTRTGSPHELQAFVQAHSGHSIPQLSVAEAHGHAETIDQATAALVDVIRTKIAAELDDLEWGEAPCTPFLDRFIEVTEKTRNAILGIFQDRHLDSQLGKNKVD